MNNPALMELADRLAEQWRQRMAEYSADKDYASAGVIGLVLMEFNALSDQLRTAAAEGGSLAWLINDMEQTVASVESMWQAPADSDSSAQYEAGRQMAYMTLGNLLRDTLSEWEKKIPSPPTDSGAGRDGINYEHVVRLLDAGGFIVAGKVDQAIYILHPELRDNAIAGAAGE